MKTMSIYEVVIALKLILQSNKKINIADDLRNILDRLEPITQLPIQEIKKHHTELLSLLADDMKKDIAKLPHEHSYFSSAKHLKSSLQTIQTAMNQTSKLDIPMSQPLSETYKKLFEIEGLRVSVRFTQDPQYSNQRVQGLCYGHACSSIFATADELMPMRQEQNLFLPFTLRTYLLQYQSQGIVLDNFHLIARVSLQKFSQTTQLANFIGTLSNTHYGLLLSNKALPMTQFSPGHVIYLRINSDSIVMSDANCCSVQVQKQDQQQLQKTLDVLLTPYEKLYKRCVMDVVEFKKISPLNPACLVDINNNYIRPSSACTELPSDSNIPDPKIVFAILTLMLSSAWYFYNSEQNIFGRALLLVCVNLASLILNSEKIVKMIERLIPPQGVENSQNTEVIPINPKFEDYGLPTAAVPSMLEHQEEDLESGMGYYF